MPPKREGWGLAPVAFNLDEATMMALGVLRGRGVWTSRSRAREAVTHVQAAAIDRQPRNVWIRTAGTAERFYLDLADERRHVVEVTAEGRHLTTGSPVLFRRPPGMLALPTPAQDGDVTRLRQILSIENEDVWLLALGWLVSALSPRGPYLVGVVQGASGYGKSTFCRVLAYLIDHRKPQLARLPSDARDVLIAAHNRWVLAFDNLTGLTADKNATFTGLATGTGSEVRELYANQRSSGFQVCRPALLNGIEVLTAREDMQNRCAYFDLPQIPKRLRRTEEELWTAVESAHPVILAGLLDYVAAGLRTPAPVVPADGWPRMADCAKWVERCFQGHGHSPGEFTRVLTASQRTAQTAAVTESPLLPVVVELAGLGFEGTATELQAALATLSPTARSRPGWPTAANQLIRILNDQCDVLAESGIEFVALPRSRFGSRYRLGVVTPNPPPPPGPELKEGFESTCFQAALERIATMNPESTVVLRLTGGYVVRGDCVECGSRLLGRSPDAERTLLLSAEEFNRYRAEFVPESGVVWLS